MGLQSWPPLFAPVDTASPVPADPFPPLLPVTTTLLLVPRRSSCLGLTWEGEHVAFLFLCLAYFTNMMSTCTHFAADGKIPFFFSWIVLHCVCVSLFTCPFTCPSISHFLWMGEWIYEEDWARPRWGWFWSCCCLLLLKFANLFLEESQRGRERSFSCWFTLQIGAITHSGSGQSQEPQWSLPDTWAIFCYFNAEH